MKFDTPWREPLGYNSIGLLQLFVFYLLKREITQYISDHQSLKTIQNIDILFL